MGALFYYNYDFGTSLIMETNHNNILSFFFNGDKLIRKSTDPRPLVKEDQHNKKHAAQEALIAAMSEYLSIKPDAHLLELAYALKNNYVVPPLCPVCRSLTKFNRNGWSAHCSISCSLKNEQVVLAKRETSLQKWGVIHQFSRADSMAKKAAFHATQNITRDKMEARHARKIRQEQLREERINAREVFLQERKAAKSAKYVAAGFVNVIYGKKDRVVSVTCAKCESIFTNPRVPQCFICHAPARESTQWRFMQQFPEHIRDLRIPNGDKKFKLDATWPDKNLAFEFNGLYWHSSAPMPGGKASIDKFYHQTKMLAAKDAGIRLIMIWEDRAEDENYCRHLHSFFTPQRKIFARKCRVISLTSAESSAFLKQHHRDGAVKSASIHIGLEYNGELVSVATFGKNRFRGEGVELYRLASAIGTNVVGGISKLISNFRRAYPQQKLTTYSDAEWGWGEGYLKAGGTLVGLTKPGYFYYDQKNGGRVHRLKLSRGNFQKFTGLEWDPSLNETENAARARCYQIWNCGNWKFEWEPLQTA